MVSKPQIPQVTAIPSGVKNVNKEPQNVAKRDSSSVQCEDSGPPK